MLQNTTHFNQDDFRAQNFMMGLEKTHGVIKLKHVERDFHIVYDPMKPSQSKIVLGEMRMVKRKVKSPFELTVDIKIEVPPFPIGMHQNCRSMPLTKETFDKARQDLAKMQSCPPMLLPIDSELVTQGCKCKGCRRFRKLIKKRGLQL